jgi:hypothetical protein
MELIMLDGKVVCMAESAENFSVTHDAFGSFFLK